jgi:predicted MFS family arabinose efflux permease
MKSAESSSRDLTATKPILFLLAASCAATVANLYYIQPLLSQVAAGFGVPDTNAGIVATATQLGYALGMFFFVPLGDRLERRGLIVKMTLLSGLFLFAAGSSPSLSLLCVFSIALGMATIVPQLIVPLTAHISAPEERGGNIGTVMSGLLIGILLSRTFSGFWGEAFGWRSVFRTMAFVMLLLAVLLRMLLPPCPATTKESYSKLLASLPTLAKTQPVLREASVNGFLMFGAFSAFWTCLVFYLSSPVFGNGQPRSWPVWPCRRRRRSDCPGRRANCRPKRRPVFRGNWRNVLPRLLCHLITGRTHINRFSCRRHIVGFRHTIRAGFQSGKNSSTFR